MILRRPAGYLLWTAVAVLATIAWSGWLAAMHLAGERSLVDRIEEPLTDLRLLVAGPLPPPANVAIVAIDDATVASEGGYPLPRSRLAALVRAIDAAGARALAIDLLLVDPTTPQDDAALAEALASIPTVIAAAGRFDRSDAAAGAFPATADELWPLPAFTAAASVGFANVSTDAAGTPRHLPLLFQTSRGPMPGFALRAVGLYDGIDPVLGRDGVTTAGSVVPLDLGWNLPLRIHGPARSIGTVSAADVLAGNGRALGGRLALLGVSATAVGDTFATPFDPVTPGVEILATGIANLLDGTALVRDVAIRRIDAAAALVLSVGGVALVSLLPLTAGLVIAASALLLWIAATFVLLGEGLWLSAGLPLAAALPPIGIAVLARQMHERRVTRRLEEAERSLRRFQPPALARRIARDPQFLREPIEQPAAILFIDLSGFTTRSEELGPLRTRAFLKEFHTIVVEETAARQGVVLNFMGDGAMTVFGVPDAAPDTTSQALAAAFALTRRVGTWLRTAAGVSHGIGVRVGLHYGTVVLSRLGHDAHQQITVSGDNVNVASRLTEVAKAHGATLAVSAELLDTLDKDRAGFGEPDSVQLIEIRGRRQPVTVALWLGGNRDSDGSLA
ncbi:CHASE2 domain-containing protein [Aurantimonas endophytica]|uniref:Adenylate cyclase n=1 Tax=Aurantimonas endophytica TaxID=1522175 RepID=A0A7W6MR18_9HYPH|nr:adenylate/guanylate cyclase domain-containing protein [Aurantimonas endophytica]MBB4004518.1 adenylate cyclase [Aurantimonas endophytica]MCO6405354.1 CHASE2 domain-containing protein [Aurantimonas endophytica]